MNASKDHSCLPAGWAALTILAATLGGADTASAIEKLLVFSQPIPQYDSIWMADSKGFFKAEGLDVTFRMFPSGTTAMQIYRTGEGDILMGGDLPGVNYWLAEKGNYRLIAALARDPKGYLLTANKSIQKPQDLKGKTVAIRVGSTVDWFMSEYLTKAGLSAKDVTVKNLDGTVMPAALCRGDIDAFFYWQPHNDKAIEICPDKAHNVSDAQGFIPGYVIAAARPDWLAKPENASKAIAYLRAALKGKEVAGRDYPSVAAYGKEKYSMEEPVIQTAWKNNFRMITLNDITWKDYCSMAAWMRQENLLKDKFDLKQFVWLDGLRTIDPKLVSEPPPPC